MRSALFFAYFPEQRSCARTVRELHRLGMLLPRRQPGRPLRWEKPTIGIVRQFLSPRGCLESLTRIASTSRTSGSGETSAASPSCDPATRRGDRDHRSSPRLRDREPMGRNPSDPEVTRPVCRAPQPGAPAARFCKASSCAGCIAVAPCRSAIARCGVMAPGDTTTTVPVTIQRAVANADTRRARQLDAMVIDAFLERLHPVGLEAIRDAWTMAKGVEVEGVYLVQSSLNHARQRRAELSGATSS